VGQNLIRGLLVNVVLFCITLPACDSGRSEKLEKQNAEILAQLHSQQTAQLYDLKAKCAQEAKAYFTATENPAKGPSTYQNHYNKSLNKCLIWISGQSFMDQNNEWYAYEDVTDLHDGNKLLGQFLEIHSPTLKLRGFDQPIKVQRGGNSLCVKASIRELAPALYDEVARVLIVPCTLTNSGVRLNCSCGHLRIDGTRYSRIGPSQYFECCKSCWRACS
jgi:hypothetical protein